MPRLPDDDNDSAVATLPGKKGGAKEVSLPEAITSRELPVFRCRVVYLGNQENHSISFGGQIAETWLEDPDGPVQRKDRDKVLEDGTVIEGKMRNYTVQKRCVVDNGTTQYNFESRDSLGRLITDRIMPADTQPKKLANRPFTYCEHIGHLRRFALARDERNEKLYEIRLAPEQIPMLQSYISRRAKLDKANSDLLAEVIG